MVELEKTMFREYDIRGKVKEGELNQESIRFIGMGFATMLLSRGVSSCIVGFDARSYSEELRNALVEGMTSTGVNVIDIGMVTTPMAYFAQHFLKVKGVAMITASHNPNGWSGLKLGFEPSSTLVPAEIKELYKIIQDESFAKGKGKVSKQDVLDAYIKDLSSRVKINSKIKAVVNARHGIGGKVLPKVLKAAGVEVVELYCNIDFNYPHGDANPSIDAMMEELGKRVVAEQAHLGLAIDADGDRIGMTDENGKNIYPDRILILLARNLLKESKGAKIVFDVKSTQALEEDIKAHGGIPVMWKTGHSYIKQKAHEIGAALAGERSGHIFFMKGYYGFDDACFASLKLLEYIANENKPVSEIVDSIPKYFTSPVMHAYCPDEVKYKVMEKVIAKFKKKFDKVIDINGARVVFDDGWGLVRPSSNLPVFVMVFEAKSRERLKEIEQLFRKELDEFPEISKKWENG